MKRCNRAFALLIGFVLVGSSLGCAFGEIYWDDPLKREYSLSEIQKRYTYLVRFGSFHQAARFVDPNLADAFVRNLPDDKEFVFTDFETGPIHFDDESERETATVIVEYTGYYANSVYVIDIIETQKWYREGQFNNWLVRPEFEGLREVAKN